MLAVSVGVRGEDTHCCELMKKKSQGRSEYRWVYIERADSHIEGQADYSAVLDGHERGNMSVWSRKVPLSAEENKVVVFEARAAGRSIGG